MYCPKCAAQNMENARFCRVCGADISLVPAALTGTLPQITATSDFEEGRRERWRRYRSKGRPASYEKAFENIGVSLAFLIISLFVAFLVPSGKFWWFWLLIPMFASFGAGIGQFVRLKRELPPATNPTDAELPPASRGVLRDEVSARGTSEIIAVPPSVTEGTTRHLNVEARDKQTAMPE